MAGNFTASQLLNIKLKAEQMWSDGQFSTDLKPEAEAAIAVLANQTARFRDLENPGKDHSVVVNWVKACDIEDEACVSNCDLTEDELDTDGKTYALDTCRKAGFSIDEEKIRTNTYSMDELAAQGLAKSIKVLDEFWAKQVITKLKAFSGVNVAAAPYTWDGANARTSVPAAEYNRKLVAYLIKTGVLNRIRNFYLLDNGELFIDWQNARFDAGNLDGKGDQARISALNMYFDMFNFAATGVTEDTFLIGKNAVAMTTRARNEAYGGPREIRGQVNQTLYTVNSNSLPGVKYDVYYTVECKTINGKAHYIDTWRLETNGLIALNPEACPVTVEAVQYNPTGVLAFIKS